MGDLSARSALLEKVWQRTTGDGAFEISTQHRCLNHGFINAAFGSDDMYWAEPLPLEVLDLMLSQSLTLGLYKFSPVGPEPSPADSPSSPRTPPPTLESEPQEKREMIGMARFVTDYVSTAYLTDVYIDPAYRQRGLAKWLIACCNEVLKDHPALRRAFLMASPGVGQAFYKREMGFWDVRDEHEKVVAMSRKTYVVPEH